jgi:hypothetical protein
VSDVLADILRVLLSGRGYVTIQCQAFFDESGSHDGSPILCLAGYIFKKSEAIKLGHEWRKVLAWKKLPYFHMVKCAHGNGPFANLTKPERIEVATKMIEVIKRRAIQGMAVTVNSDDCAEVVLNNSPLTAYRSAYSFCAHNIMAGITVWIDNNPTVKEMAYFFEAGHQSANEANQFMVGLFSTPQRKEEYRYVAHGFVEKRRSPAVQAADLLAWQWYKDRKNQLEGRPRRADCASLLQLRHIANHLNRDRLEGIVRDYVSKANAFLLARAQSS